MFQPRVERATLLIMSTAALACFCQACGKSTSDSTTEVSVRRPDGTQVTTGVLHASLGKKRPSDIATCPDGGAVVVTENYDHTASVIKLDATAAVVWERSIDGSAVGSELARVAISAAGTVYVAATTRFDIHASPQEGDDIEITAFDPTGMVRPGWPQRIDVDFRDWVSDIAVDANENVHVAGTAIDREYTYDAERPYVAWYREDGSVLRAAELVDAGSTQPETAVRSRSIALTPDGHLYMNLQVLHFDGNGGGSTRLTAFDAGGEVVAGYPMTLAEGVAYSAMAVGPNGDLFVFESQRVYTIDANGTLLDDSPPYAELPDAGQYWRAESANAFAASSTGDLYFVGTVRDQPGNPGPSPTSDVFVHSLTPMGESRAGFPVHIATPDWDEVSAVSIDPDGAYAWVAWEMPNGAGTVTRVPTD